MNDVLLTSDHPFRSFLRIGRSAGYAQYGGMPVIVESGFHISEEEYQRRRAMPWPEVPGTFVPAQFIRDQNAIGNPMETPGSSGPVVTEEIIGGSLTSPASQAELDAIADLFNQFRQQSSQGRRAAVVEHLARYRLGVIESFRQLPAFKEQSPNTIRKVLRMLQRESLIASRWLHHSRRYWHLTEWGAAQSQLPPGRSGALGEAAKLRAYAIVRFCCLSDRPRQRLTSDELRAHFPELHRPGMPPGYYFDPHGTGRMGLMRVDAGLHGRWDRVVQSVRDDLREHLMHLGLPTH